MVVAQRIRVSFSDPDATDSDSGDDSSHVPARRAAIKSEIIIQVTACTSTSNPTHPSTTIKSASGQPPPPPQLPRMQGTKAARSTPNRRFRGVYERQPGRWAADFRSHRLNVRRWIGTFPSEEEAKAAYDAFAAQFTLGASVEPVTPDWVLPVATPTRSIVLDDSDQSEIGPNHQADALSTVSSSPPTMFPSPTSPPPTGAVTTHERLPYADEPQMDDRFLPEVLAHDDPIRLADLPLPSLDDKLDFGSGEWSLLNIDVPALCQNECNLGA